MNLIRGPEPERRVAPIDSGPRTRVKAGLRRDQPRDWLEEREAGEDFPRELARQQERQEDESGEAESALREPRPSEEAPETRLAEDRVEIEGLAAQGPPQLTPPAGPRLDVKV